MKLNWLILRARFWASIYILVSRISFALSRRAVMALARVEAYKPSVEKVSA